ncbi:MAG TPA: hypothetical protein VMT57_04735 [Candidatus Thermoplasmatota archaeon]|nr:hypothetical protein [Candidatus Thermoplasmatota archaeon]
MGRTIALKLSPKEEQIVRQLNKQGMTNSELLRNALRQYFEYLHQTTGLISPENPISTASVVFQDSLRNVINEVEDIRSSLEKTKVEMQHENERIHQTLSELCVDAAVNQNSSTGLPSIGLSKDIHEEVDSFLEQHFTRGDGWKKNP